MNYIGMTAREKAQIEKLAAARERTMQAFKVADEKYLVARLALSMKYGPKYRVPAELEEELAKTEYGEEVCLPNAGV